MGLLMSRWVLDVGVLFGVLDEKRQRDGLSWNAVARQLGFRSVVFSRMAAGRAPDSHNLGVMLLWLGWAPELALLVVERPPSDAPADGRHSPGSVS
jgi:hypothetical protein